MSIPTDLKYTEQHEWVRVEGNVATVGITDYAQHALGDLTFVEPPKVGKALAKGDEAVVIESAKAAASVYAPLTGTVVEVNAALADDPGQVNQDPYGSGWMFKLRMENPDEVEPLLSAEAYAELAGKE